MRAHPLPSPTNLMLQRCLCTGEAGVGRGGKPLHYKGSLFHRIIPQARAGEPHCWAAGGRADATGGTPLGKPAMLRGPAHCSLPACCSLLCVHGWVRHTARSSLLAVAAAARSSCARAVTLRMQTALAASPSTVSLGGISCLSLYCAHSCSASWR